MIVRWVFLTVYLLLADCKANELEIVSSFLNAKRLTRCTVFSCLSIHHKMETLKYLMQPGRVVSVLSTEDHRTGDDFNSSLYMDYGNIGVVLDMECENAGILLSWAANYKKINSNYHWLLFHKSIGGMQKMFEENAVELNLESEVICVSMVDTEDLRVFEVYQTGTRPHGQLVTRELPAGKWSGRKWHLDTRMDLQGLLLNVTEVVKPNSVETTRLSDVSQIQDEEEIIKYLTDHTTYYLDSMSKFSWAIFEIQMDLFNFSSRLVPTASWGYVFDGKFDGMVSRLINGSADVGATALAIRLPRVGVVDYTSQIWPYQVLFILRHPRQPSVRDTYMRPLSPGVWLCSALLILLMFAIMCLVNWQLRLKHRLPTDWLSWSTSIIIIISAAAQQGSAVVPRQLSLRIVFFMLFAWAMILYQFYTSSIVSSLLMPPRRYINTIADLVHSPFVIGFEKVLTTKDTLNRYSAIMPIVKTMYDKHVKPKGDAAYYTPVEGVKCLQGGHFAFYVDTASAYKLIEDTLTQSEICDLVEVTLIAKEVLALPVQKGSPYRKLFTYGQRKMIESGIIIRQLNRWQSRQPICVTKDRHGNNIPEKAQVGIVECSPVFLLLLVGIIASLLLLLCERVHFNYSTRDLGKPLITDEAGESPVFFKGPVLRNFKDHIK